MWSAYKLPEILLLLELHGYIICWLRLCPPGWASCHIVGEHYHWWVHEVGRLPSPRLLSCIDQFPWQTLGIPARGKHHTLVVITLADGTAGTNAGTKCRNHCSKHCSKHFKKHCFAGTIGGNRWGKPCRNPGGEPFWGTIPGNHCRNHCRGLLWVTITGTIAGTLAGNHCRNPCGEPLWETFWRTIPGVYCGWPLQEPLQGTIVGNHRGELLREPLQGTIARNRFVQHGGNHLYINMVLSPAPLRWAPGHANGTYCQQPSAH